MSNSSRIARLLFILEYFSRLAFLISICQIQEFGEIKSNLKMIEKPYAKTLDCCKLDI